MLSRAGDEQSRHKEHAGETIWKELGVGRYDAHGFAFEPRKQGHLTREEKSPDREFGAYRYFRCKDPA